MLDMGHLLHTNTALRTQEEGVVYINSLLDMHGAVSLDQGFIEPIPG